MTHSDSRNYVLGHFPNARITNTGNSESVCYVVHAEGDRAGARMSIHRDAFPSAMSAWGAARLIVEAKEGGERWAADLLAGAAAPSTLVSAGVSRETLERLLRAYGEAITHCSENRGTHAAVRSAERALRFAIGLPAAAAL